MRTKRTLLTLAGILAMTGLALVAGLKTASAQGPQSATGTWTGTSTGGGGQIPITIVLQQKGKSVSGTAAPFTLDGAVVDSSKSFELVDVYISAPTSDCPNASAKVLTGLVKVDMTQTPNTLTGIITGLNGSCAAEVDQLELHR